MKIKMVSSYFDYEQSRVAWLNSRPNENKNIHIGEILALDLPVNEFAFVNVFIESTILEREIIATMRNHIMWAQTSRVQNPLEFEIDPRVAHKWDYESMRDKMRVAALKERQDDYRLMLPMMSLTKYSISINLRGLVKLALYFRELWHHGDATKDLFKNAFYTMVEFIEHDLGIDMKYFEQYKAPKILTENYPMGRHESMRVADTIVVSTQLPYHLRAQLVRHRNIGVSDSLMQHISSGAIIREDLRAVLSVTAYGREQDFVEVISKRSCWVAHYAIWSEFLNLVQAQMEEVNFLPCKNGACPFDADVNLRLEGKDPNPPCPIHMKMNGAKASVSQATEMRKMVVADNRPYEFWNDKINVLEMK